MKKKILFIALSLNLAFAFQGLYGAPSSFVTLNSSSPSSSEEVAESQSLAVRPMGGSPKLQKLAAKTSEIPPDSQGPKRHVIGVEGRVACFIPQSHRLRKVYGSQGYAEYQLEGCMPFTCLRDCEPKWIGWGNLSFYEKTGKSTCLHNGTHIKNGAFNMGAKYFFCHTDGYRPYLGLGIGFAYVNFRDHSPGVRTHIHKWGPALLVKAGVEIDFAYNIYADLFADYSSNWFGNTHSKHCVKTHHVNTGGGNFGLGLGYRF